ncbi:twin-arginine translocation signal domain-containing protein, partial [uncultured Gimesia sp.]|nr:oxidoreductase [Planctomycetaceae bacterium]
MDQSPINRRDFLKTSGTTAVAASTIAGLASAPAFGAGNSNEAIRIAFIGPGGRGFGAHVKKLVQLKKDGMNIELVAVA